LEVGVSGVLPLSPPAVAGTPNEKEGFPGAVELVAAAAPLVAVLGAPKIGDVAPVVVAFAGPNADDNELGVWPNAEVVAPLVLVLGATPNGDAVLVVDPKAGVEVVVEAGTPKLNFDVVPAVAVGAAPFLAGPAAGVAAAAGFPNEKAPPVGAAGCCVAAAFASPPVLEPPKKLNLVPVEVAEEAGAVAVVAAGLLGFDPNTDPVVAGTPNEKPDFFSSVADGWEAVAEGCPNTEVVGGVPVALAVEADTPKENGLEVAVGVVAEAGAPGVLKENKFCDEAAG
jgi:hypothetical protein